MKITNIEVARKFNLGNFETQDIKLTAEVEETEDVKEVIEKLKQEIKDNAGR